MKKLALFVGALVLGAGAVAQPVVVRRPGPIVVRPAPVVVAPPAPVVVAPEQRMVVTRPGRVVVRRGYYYGPRRYVRAPHRRGGHYVWHNHRRVWVRHY